MSLDSTAGLFSLEASASRTPPAPTQQHSSHFSQRLGGSAAQGGQQGQHTGPHGGGGGAQQQQPTGGPDGAPKGPKPQREMTKAERRALQESQRAAKAAQKGAEDGIGAVAEKPSKATSGEMIRGGRGAAGPMDARLTGGKPSAAGGAGR